MMLTCESPQEAKLLEFIAQELAGRDVHIESLGTDAGGAVDVTLRLPESAGRADREVVLRLLSDFERREDFAVITNPTILLGPSED